MMQGILFLVTLLFKSQTMSHQCISHTLFLVRPLPQRIRHMLFLVTPTHTLLKFLIKAVYRFKNFIELF